MDRLWTPWRREFIESSAAAAANSTDQAADSSCFLCVAVGHDQSEDRSSLVVHRAERVFVVLNRYPYNSGHVMVAPYLHSGDFATLNTAIAHDLVDTAQRCVKVLTQVYRPDAFNLGLNLGRPAGAGLPDHLHIHVVPRWSGDTNFMPVVAETKVLPETLDQTYDRLAPLFKG